MYVYRLIMNTEKTHSEYRGDSYNTPPKKECKSANSSLRLAVLGVKVGENRVKVLRSCYLFTYTDGDENKSLCDFAGRWRVRFGLVCVKRYSISSHKKI